MAASLRRLPGLVGNGKIGVGILLALLACCIGFSALAWMQTRATVTFDVRAVQPVHLQVFYSASGAFSERDSVRVVALPANEGHIRVRIPAARTGYLRLDPNAAAPPFEVCGLQASGAGRYRPGPTNQLSWTTRADCARLAADQASVDPFVVMASEQPADHPGTVRAWRWAARLSLVASLLLLGLLAWRLDRSATPLSLRAEHLFRRLSAHAHWFAFVAMVMMGSLIAHALPPNGIPDEIAHLSKTAKVSAGALLTDSGTVPVVDVLDMYANMNDVREPAVINAGALSTALAKPLACTRAVRALPTMADGYAPHLYAVPAVVLSASCALETSFGTFLTLSRIINLILAAALIAIGIRVAMFGKWSLVAVGLLPMTLTQIASVSADSLTLSLSFCFLGVVSGLAGGRLTPSRVRYWLPLLALMIAFAKPGSAWILVAILFCRRAYPDRRAFVVAVLTVLVIPWLAHVGWSMLSVSGARPLAGVDPENNLALLRDEPLQVAMLGINTFLGPHGEFIYKSTLGLLGWLDIPLSGWAYALGGVAVVASLFTNDRAPVIALPVRTVAIGAAVGSLAMLSFPLFVYWTNPASGIVMGLQGRYFLPTLAFVLVWMALRARPVVRLILLGAILAMPLMTLDAVRQINDRYYLVGL